MGLSAVAKTGNVPQFNTSPYTYSDFINKTKELKIDPNKCDLSPEELELVGRKDVRLGIKTEVINHGILRKQIRDYLERYCPDVLVWSAKNKFQNLFDKELRSNAGYLIFEPENDEEKVIELLYKVKYDHHCLVELAVATATSRLENFTELYDLDNVKSKKEYYFYFPSHDSPSYVSVNPCDLRNSLKTIGEAIEVFENAEFNLIKSVS